MQYVSVTVVDTEDITGEMCDSTGRRGCSLNGRGRIRSGMIAEPLKDVEE